MSALDWPALMRAGLAGLRLTPDRFWQLTPAELRMMLGHSTGTSAMNRAGLDALLAAYPDRMKGERNDGS